MISDSIKKANMIKILPTIAILGSRFMSILWTVIETVDDLFSLLCFCSSMAVMLMCSWLCCCRGQPGRGEGEAQVLGAGGGVHREAVQLSNGTTIINHRSFKRRKTEQGNTFIWCTY
uniref:Uncharacterized protein n=1 Tax=Arundo donax TaxID=35708 RepID=A0A0A9DJP7_ARUDO